MLETKTLSDFGANLDQIGQQNNTQDLSANFAKAASFFEECGGGVLVLEGGYYRTGPIQLVSNMTLYLKKGAFLSFIPEPELYLPIYTRWEGVMCYAMHPCIFASKATNVSITGEGVIDGTGSEWWRLLPEKKQIGKPTTKIEKQLASLNSGYQDQPGGGGGRNTQFLRPSLVEFNECTSCSISGVTLQNSPFWACHPVFCDGLVIDSIKVINPSAAPNTDGMDIDSCKNVEVKNCSISVGDDGIAIKSGSGIDGIRVNRPSANIKIQGCRVESAHGGVVFGSETAAGIENVTVSDCVFDGTERGIRIKTRRGRGGKVTNLSFSNITMKNNLCPIAINMYYRCGTNGTEKDLFSLEKLPISEDTPSIQNIKIKGVKAENCRASAGFIVALPESPLTNLEITDSVFTVDTKAKALPSVSEMYSGIPDVTEKSFRIINAKDPVFKNVQITGPEKPFIFE